MSRLLIVIIGLCCSLHLAASSEVKQIEIPHEAFESPLVFNVILPSGYSEQESKRYPMLFDFHPQASTYLRGMHDWLSHNGEWPWLKTIIVTPAQGNNIGKLFDATGKTTPLLDFFEQALFVEIDKTYRTNNFRIMSGFRYNGSIVLSALFRKPNLFNAYFAASPELKDDFLGLLSNSEKALAGLDKKPRFLLFSYAQTIKEDHQQATYDEFATHLSNSAPNSLTWHIHNFSGSYHMSVPLLTTIKGIEMLFDDIHNGLAPDSDIASKGVDAIIAHYQFISNEKYGFEVSPRRSIENRGHYLLEQNDPKGLATLYKLIELYPDDAYSYHNVAKGYASLGNYTEAVTYQKQAVKLASNRLTWHQKRLQTALDTYVQRAKTQ